MKKLNVFLGIFCVISGLSLFYTGHDRTFLNGFIVGWCLVELLNKGIAYLQKKEASITLSFEKDVDA